MVIGVGKYFILYCGDLSNGGSNSDGCLDLARWFKIQNECDEYSRLIKVVLCHYFTSYCS